MHIKRKVLNLTIILLSTYGYSIGQSKEEVIEKYLNALGGKENWLAVRSTIDSGMIIKYKSESFFNKEARTDTVFFSTTLEMPNKLRFNSYKRHWDASSNKTWTQSSMCYNGTYLWTGRPGSIIRQTPEESESFANTIASGSPYLFLYDKTAEIEYVGKIKLDSTDYEVLKVKGTHHFFYQLIYFDQVTGLIACTVGYDTSIKRYNYSRDYKRIDNVLIEMSGESYVDGVLTGKSILLMHKVNPTISDSAFKEN